MVTMSYFFVLFPEHLFSFIEGVFQMISIPSPGQVIVMSHKVNSDD